MIRALHSVYWHKFTKKTGTSPPPRIPSLPTCNFFFSLWEFMSKSSVTEHEMHKEEGKCLNPATLPISCLWECPHTDLGRLWVRRKGGDWQHPFHADLAWPSVSEHPRIHPSVYFLAASQMSWCWMLDVDCFFARIQRKLNCSERKRMQVCHWSGHNCIHTVGLLRQMLEYTVITIRGKPLPMKLKN